MSDRALFRWGGMAAVGGAILALVFNLLHPRLTETEDTAQELLRIVAANEGWLGIHLGLMLAVSLIVLGLFAVARSTKGTPGEGLGRLALGGLLVSAPVALFTLVAVDGYATKAVADAWAAAPQADQASALAAGTAVSEIAWGTFMFTAMSFLGVTPILFGAAIAASRVYPAWLGWVAVVFGVASVVAGLWGTLDGPSGGFFLVFTVSSIVLTLFVLVTGVLLTRMASEAAAARVPA
jgi:hypothetical protein